MKKIAVIIYGPPGSGKGTQANLLAQKFNLIHFDTGKFLEAVVHDPKRAREKVIARERRLFDTGKLNTPSWVLRVVALEVRKIHRAGWGITFSGSPRTVFETKKLMPVLARLYGRDRIFVFILAVPPSASLKRNSARRICSVCGAPLLIQYYPNVKPRHCPVCAGPFYRRSLDNPATIRTRLREYRERTEPIFAVMKNHGYRLTRIDGTPPPYKVFKKISRFIAQELTKKR